MSTNNPSTNHLSTDRVDPSAANALVTDELIEGKVQRWHDDKGYGFIDCQAGALVFFHISVYQGAGRPSLGEAVVLRLGQDDRGRLQAKQVAPLKAIHQQMATKNQQIRARNRQRQQRGRQAEFKAAQRRHLVLGAGFYGVLILLASTGALPWLIVAWYALIGIVTYMMYAKDKAAATAGDWRTPESTLHVLSMLGGWVGAMIAQTYLRHKSQKQDFRVVYYLTAVINLAGLLFILTRGSHYLSQAEAPIASLVSQLSSFLAQWL